MLTLVPFLASVQGHQATQLGPKRTQHACQGRRVRSCNPHQDGTSVSFQLHPSCSDNAVILTSQNTFLLASGKTARPIADSLPFHFVLWFCIVFLLSTHLSLVLLDLACANADWSTDLTGGYQSSLVPLRHKVDGYQRHPGLAQVDACVTILKTIRMPTHVQLSNLNTSQVTAR